MNLKTAVKLRVLLTLAGLLVALGGCSINPLGTGTPQTRFFVVSPLTVPEPPDGGLVKKDEIEIAIEQLVIPSYLDRPQIVIRTGDNELHISEFNQWGENLRGNLSRVFLENLALLMDSDNIFLVPSIKRQSPDLRVAVRIIQFERGQSGAPHLTVRWTLYDREKKVIFRENLVLTGENVGRYDYPAIVKAMSDLLADLSRRIVVIIRKHSI
ncbi:MAG: membrane integrity-associated transporter subunit PqiC [Magnetococcales bacterium]|nr:membrane integrity-associated transporter subunit PqiC [Magnetococcales bacterium]